jgi:hypothetical protein
MTSVHRAGTTEHSACGEHRDKLGGVVDYEGWLAAMRLVTETYWRYSNVWKAEAIESKVVVYAVWFNRYKKFNFFLQRSISISIPVQRLVLTSYAIYYTDSSDNMNYS